MQVRKIAYVIASLLLLVGGLAFSSATAWATTASPTVTTGNATSVTTNSATLNGTVNPNGTSTTYQFEYGTTTSDWSVSPSTPASAGSGTTAVAEKANLTGLKTSTDYFYRLVATANGVTTDGTTYFFQTSPAILQYQSLNGSTPSKSPITFTSTGGTGTTSGNYTLDPVASGTLGSGDWIDVTDYLPSYTGLSYTSYSATAPQTGITDSCTSPESTVPQPITCTFTNTTSSSLALTSLGSIKVNFTLANDAPAGNFSNTASIDFYGNNGSSNEVIINVINPPPTVITNAATSITSDSATLNGTVNPNGNQTHYQFEYGTTTSYGLYGPSSGNVYVGSGTSDVSVAVNISGLTPSTTYDYRIDANYAGFTYVYGSNETFTTPAAPKPPTVTTSSATSVTDLTATLNGTVNPNGTSTTYQFQYGTSTSYGSVSPSTAASAGSGTTAVAEKANLSGLAAGTTYDFRLVASNANGATDGANETFTTAAAPVPPTPPAPTPTPPALTPKPKTSSPKFIILGQTGSSSPKSLTTPYVPATTPYIPGTCSNAATGATYQVTSTGVLEDGISGPVFLGHYAANDGERVVACATTPNGKGIWLVTNFGRVYAEGTATNFGDMRSTYGICDISGTPVLPYSGVPTSGQRCSTRELNAPIVGITSTPSGNGYWLVGADGGVFNFGSAKFLGSTYSYGITGLSGSHPLNAPVTGLISTPNGNGYWLVGADGGVFNFGSAKFLGSSYSSFGRAIQNPNIYFELSAQNRVVRGYLTGKGVGGWLSTGGQN